MTTEHTELIAEVQTQLAHHKHHSFFERDWKVADNLKALLDAIEAQGREIERLTVERDVNKRMRDQHFAELEDVRSQVATLNVGFNNVQTDRDQIAASRYHIAKTNDSLRAQLAALQSDDELPEIPVYPMPTPFRPQDHVYNRDQMQSYARQAQAMARAKMVPLEKDAATRYQEIREVLEDLMDWQVKNLRIWTHPTWDNAQAVIDRHDAAMGITGEPK